MYICEAIVQYDILTPKYHGSACYRLHVSGYFNGPSCMQICFILVVLQ